MKWHEASKRHSTAPLGICHVSLEELMYHSLHTGSSLSCLLHGFPEVSLPAKAGITSPSQCMHQLPPTPCISRLSVVSQQAPVSHTVHSRGLKTGSRLRRRPFLPLPAFKQFLEPHIHPQVTLIGLKETWVAQKQYSGLLPEPLGAVKMLRNARKKSLFQ